MNQKLKEAVVDIDWDKDNFMLHYITLQQPAENSYVRPEQGAWNEEFAGRARVSSPCVVDGE